MIPNTFLAKPSPWPDRTRHAWDEIALHTQALGTEANGHWVAIRLSDGGSDGIAYPSKTRAVRGQLHEHQCAYICIHPFGEMSHADIHRYLELNEQIYDAGGRLSDIGTHIVPSSLA